MAAASYTLVKFDDSEVVFTLVGNTAEGAVYRLSSRTLALPLGIDFTVIIGNPGSKGNDHIKVVLKDVIANSTTGAISTGSVSLDLSVPRDSTWTDTMSKDLLAYLVSLLTDARITSLVDGLVP